jgi:EF-P beta-lysylation protein EpmB
MRPISTSASLADSDQPLQAGWDHSGWKAALADSVTEPEELCRRLGLSPSTADSAGRAAGGFPLRVPGAFLDRIRPGDPLDPLLLQVLPTEDETRPSPGFTHDPLGECHAACTPRLLSKYSGRSLIVATRVCAVHCRFCFRRHFPPAISSEKDAPWSEALERIAGEPSLREVILSGGDPLVLDDDRLTGLANRLSHIPHLARMRIHTRMPIAIPDRVTDGLLSILTRGRLTPFVVVHVNHPAEIDTDVASALGRLVDAGVPLLSQSVLLKGINDSVDVLAELFERLVDLRVMPYYLHQLDRVAGAAHFEVPETTGIRLLQALRARLPGYAVPRYVRETPGEPNKRVLA